MLTLHHLECGQSERIIWLCEELSIPYDLKTHKRSPMLSPPELKALTPLGQAPVIEDTTFNRSKPVKLAESAAITEYIIHRHGNGRLALPTSHDDYADYLYWFHLANGNLQPSMLRSFSFRLLRLSLDSPDQKAIDARLKAIMDIYDHRLIEAPWLAGSEFTAADIMSVWSFTTMRLFYPMDLHSYEGILAWLRRVGERTAYRTAMEKGNPGFVPILGADAPTPWPGV